MAREFAKKFYKSKAWQKCRSEYIKSVHYMCEECMKHGIYRPGDIVHHIEAINPTNIYNPEITLNWNNLELLCRDCHAKKHGSSKRYKVDEFGRVTSPY